MPRDPVRAPPFIAEAVVHALAGAAAAFGLAAGRSPEPGKRWHLLAVAGLMLLAVAVVSAWAVAARRRGSR